jgi:large subunit ribosomal protein L3
VKKGMTAAWDSNGARHAITLLQVRQNQVVQVKTLAKDGYTSLQVGSVDKEARKCNKPELLHFQAYGVVPKQVLTEFRVSEDAMVPSGTNLNARHFVPGQYVDVTGITIGKGFQGAMKRWGFKGQGATHGASRSHRSLATISPKSPISSFIQ